MNLFHFIHFGYTLVIVTFVLMIWVHLYEAKVVEEVDYPPCNFNPLCTCSKTSPDLGMVRCKDIHLSHIPSSINHSKVFMLHMENNGLRFIEPYFFQSTGLYKLTISKNPIHFMSDEVFVGLERSLWELDLSDNRLMKVPHRALRYLQKLRYLNLKENCISDIKPDYWRGLENSLETLILADNSINQLPSDAFSGLPMLDTLDLRGNNLREIPASVFRDGMGKLTRILLADNQLTDIPYEALSYLKSLKYVDLSYNCINRMHPDNKVEKYDITLTLDELRLDYNQIQELESLSFQYFGMINKTWLDGNPIRNIEENAFRQAKIRELYIRKCGLTTITPLAFNGLENYLQILDMSGNNITMLPNDIFYRFNMLRTLHLGDNKIIDLNPAELFTSFQFTLYGLDLSGTDNDMVAIQDLRRLRNLRYLTLSRLPHSHISPDDFLEFGMDLEELRINSAGLQTIKNHAFQYVHSLKRLDLSDNRISSIESDAFEDIGLSLITLQLSHALSSSMQTVSPDLFRDLLNLRELDLSNNRIRNLPDTCFHFLKKLRRLEMQDNIVDEIHKGTFQGDIHSNLRDVYFSFNNIKTLHQHTFVDLTTLEQLHLDDNRIETIERRAFMNLENLKRLNLKGNKISSVSYEAFQNLPEIEDLDMSYNSLTSFDFAMFDQVGTLGMFQLNVSHNLVYNLAFNLAQNFGRGENELSGMHSNVKVLDLSYNNITIISKQYFKPAFISLTHLHLSHNSLLNASREVFGNLPHLELLDLSYNQIGEIDYNTFRDAKQMQIFLIGHNDLTELPAELFRYTTFLRFVDLSYNKLRFISDNLFREDGLEYLDLSNNQLSRFPISSISFAAAETLTELDLSWNTISSISHGEQFARFKRLARLDLSYNRLVQLDTGMFSSFNRLSDLDLSHNSQLVLERNGRSFLGIEDSLTYLFLDNVSLTYVPEFPLPNLLSLSLAYNSLPTIPPEMASNMSSLRKLNLNSNDLTAVPIVTHSLTKLRLLSLADNPITVLSNTSFLGVADHLEELDIRYLELDTFETGALWKLFALRTLQISNYEKVKNFNIPVIVNKNLGLRNLEVHVDTETDLKKEMDGWFPVKMENVTFSGLNLKTLAGDVLEGVQSPVMHIRFQNTSLSSIPDDLFENFEFAHNVSIEVFDNHNLQQLNNPSTGGKPNLARETFLVDLKMQRNKWNCDCNLGWIEVWQRKRRQYLCADDSNKPTGFKSSSYNCRHPQDDLRNSYCANKNNASLLEVLKTDIECGWSKASYSSPTNVQFLLLSFIIVYFANFRFVPVPT